MFRERLRKSPVKEKENGDHNVTLGDLGFKDRPNVFPNLGLAHAEIRSVKTKNPETGNDVYFASVDYPLKGLGLVDLLDATTEVTPYYLHTNIATLWKPTEDQWLRERYSAVRKLPEFSEFEENHVTRWSEVLKDVKNTQLYQRLQRTRFIDEEQFVSRQLQNRLEAHQNGEDASCETGNCGFPGYEIFSMYITGPDGKEAADFVAKRLEEKGGSEILLGELRKVAADREKFFPEKGIFAKQVARIRRKKIKNIDDKYHVSEPLRLELYDAFLQEIQTAPKDLQVKVLTDIEDGLYIAGPIGYIDPQAKKVWDKFDIVKIAKEYDKKEKVGKAKTSEMTVFSADNEVTISENGVAVKITSDGIEANGYSAGFYKQKEAKFTFPKNYYPNSLIPLIAWEESAEGKRFLTQNEAMQQLTQLDVKQQASIIPDQMKEQWHDPTKLAQLDVMLGRVAVLHLDADVRKDLPREVDVEDYTLHMRASEVPMLASAPDVMQRLLSTDTMANLKNHIDTSSTSAAL